MANLFLLATLSCLVDPITSLLIKLISSWCFLESSQEQEIRKELIALKKEMNSISMVDEFSRFAKLQRKYKKLESEAKENINSRSDSRTKLRLTIKYIVRVINGIFTSALLFMYRREPVIIFPTGILWPIESFLSWPSAVDSCISLPVWIALMKLTISSNFSLNV